MAEEGGQITVSSERHTNLVLRFHEEMWIRGEPAIGDELCAPNYVRHDLRPGTPPPGPEGQKEIARLFRAAFPDRHITVDLSWPSVAFDAHGDHGRGTRCGGVSGGPCRTRTCNLGIKSPLHCQLC